MAHFLMAFSTPTVSHPQTQGGFTPADFGLILSAYINELCISMGEDGRGWETSQKRRRLLAATNTQDDNDMSGEGRGGNRGLQQTASDGGPVLPYDGQEMGCLAPDLLLRAGSGRGGLETSCPRRHHESLDAAFQAWLCALSTFQPGVGCWS